MQSIVTQLEFSKFIKIFIFIHKFNKNIKIICAHVHHNLRKESDLEKDFVLKYCEDNNLDNVYFLGGRGDVPALLKVMDGFVYSSVHDTFGIAVVEAMAAGLPVVVNDYEVMKEVCGNLVTYFKSFSLYMLLYKS